MPIRYRYLDDGPETESTAYSQVVAEAVKGLKIKHEYPVAFAKQIKSIVSRFDADGLILDLRLDKEANEKGDEKDKVHYRAPALAQEIRTRAAEPRSRIVEFPIVLWSLEDRLKILYSHDNAGRDLFDLTVVKENLGKEAQEVGKKLVALARGYQEIAEVQTVSRRRHGWFYRLLGFETQGDAFFLDSQILEHFDYSQRAHSAYEVARFLIRQILDTPSPLIDRPTLAARLGLDLENSRDAEALFDKHFSQARYKGVFEGGWERWWAFLVEDAWHKLGVDEPLRELTAETRIKRLKSATRTRELQPAQPLHPDYSTSYWTICQRLHKPLDPRNGLLLSHENVHRWQEEQFVSFEACDKRLVGPRDINPVDHGRLKRMKSERSPKSSKMR